MTEFAHLHLHTEYSLLDGACRIGRLFERLKELGQTRCAVTDHGVMYGAVEFYKAAKAAGIHPVIGCEVYVAPRTRFDRVYELDREPGHLVLLCENRTGYENLCKLVSGAFLDGFYTRPRVDEDFLRQHSEGLIALSACLSGFIPRAVAQRNMDLARRKAETYRDIFGDGNFYLEVQDHGIPEQKRVNAGLFALAKELNIPVAATNDCHYLKREDAKAQDVLMCIQTAKTVDDTDRMKMDGEEFFVKSGDEMAALFPDHPEALENTIKIADRCKLDFEFGKYHLPEFPLPEGEDSSESYLRRLAEAGFRERYPNPDGALRERLDYELSMIARMGFCDYFLIVWDFIDYAKQQGIPVGPGRGSAAGSVVSYSLGITGVDPIRYSLYFERFLNPERISMPDIDIDFCVNRRQEVIDYVIGKYGADHVAQIATFGTMQARAAVRDVGRALGYTYAETDAVARLIPRELHITLEKALQTAPQLKQLAETDPRVQKLLDTAMDLEGMPRHASTHAAGVVVTAKPVDHYVPLAQIDGSVITQYPMGTLEELGLLKMDFLGLRNLTVLYDAEAVIRRDEPGFSLETLPEDDAATFEMLSAGKTAGVFQLESAGMTGVCVGLRPQSIEDISSVVALFRPGPMESIPRFIESKHNPAKVRYRHPLLRDILEVTYGCIVYQEQVLEIFRKLGGFSLGHADIVRRAMSKKKFDLLNRERQGFVSGCKENGVSESVAQGLFDEIMDFANYAFNKAHAVSYAVIAYRTAYLKRHYPRPYMAALLTSVLMSHGKLAEYIAECREMGVPVLPPDVNESDSAFTAGGGGIRFGLSSVKNVGHALVRDLTAEREKAGRFTSFIDFCERMSRYDLNRRAVESLISAGAFDSLGHKRRQLAQAYERLAESLHRDAAANVSGQIDLFGEQPSVRAELPDTEEYPLPELLAMEREVTGLYLSGHPIDAFAGEVKRLGAVPIGQLNAAFGGDEPPSGEGGFEDGDMVTLCGVIGHVKTKTTRNNSLMAYVTLEDATGAIELLVFARVLEQAGPYCRAGVLVTVRGKLSEREEKAPQVLAESIRPLSAELETADNLLPEAEGKTLYLKLPDSHSRFAKGVLPMLKEFPGPNRVVLYYADTAKRVAGTAALDTRLLERLRRGLGEENVVVK